MLAMVVRGPNNDSACFFYAEFTMTNEEPLPKKVSLKAVAFVFIFQYCMKK